MDRSWVEALHNANAETRESILGTVCVFLGVYACICVYVCVCRRARLPRAASFILCRVVVPIALDDHWLLLCTKLKAAVFLFATGEKLYSLIVVTHPQQAPKLTGMFLLLDDTEVIELIVSPESLRSKIEEAMEWLRTANQAS